MEAAQPVAGTCRKALELPVNVPVSESSESELPEARTEVELTNVPVVAAQAERFRQRLGFWTARVGELEKVR